MTLNALLIKILAKLPVLYSYTYVYFIQIRVVILKQLKFSKINILCFNLFKLFNVNAKNLRRLLNVPYLQKKLEIGDMIQK